MFSKCTRIVLHTFVSFHQHILVTLSIEILIFYTCGEGNGETAPGLLTQVFQLRNLNSEQYT